MARSKTTIKVKDLLEKVNSMIARSTCAPEGRKALAVLLSGFLHDTGNYSGFRYLDASEVPAGHLPGIVRTQHPVYDHTVTFPDDTRVEYFGNRHLYPEGREDS